MRERERERQTDRQTDIETQRETETDTDGSDWGEGKKGGGGKTSDLLHLLIDPPSLSGLGEV